MNHRLEVGMEASRKLVRDGLDRRRQEKRLEAFEKDMLLRLSENCLESRLQHRIGEEIRRENQACRSRINNRMRRKAQKIRVRKDIALAVLAYFASSVIAAWLTTWTHFPPYAAITFIVATAPFPLIRAADVLGLLQEEK